MKRALLLTTLLLVLLVGATGARAENIDLIVMVDVSESMFPVFPEVVHYLLADLLTSWLRFGDTFHLLTFADTPGLEIAATVDSKQSIEQVLRRLLLLKPLGQYTDLVAAMRFLASYAHGLPEPNRKTILLLTDGIHDPPPSSPFRLDPDQVRQELFLTAQQIARAGWKVQILRLPQGGGTEGALAPGTGGVSPGARSEVQAPPDAGSSAAAPAGAAPGAATSPGKASGSTPGTTPGGAPVATSGTTPGTTPATAAETAGAGPSPTANGPDFVPDIARALKAPVSELVPGPGSDMPGALGFPTLGFPGRVLRGGRRLGAPFVVRSSSPEALYVELASVRLDDGTELLQEHATAIVPARGSAELRATLVLPESMRAGRQKLAVEVSFAGGLRVSPSRGVLTVDYTGRPGVAAGAFGRARAAGSSALLVLLALAAVLVVALIAFGLRSRFDLGFLAKGMRRSEGRYSREREGSHPLIEMVVPMQNRHIGHRNVHALRPGGTMSVGGGRSAYLIYFVSVPPAIGYLSYDGRTYTFVPVRGELFPELPGQVADCLGRDIPAVSPRGYAFSLVFSVYRSPLDEINDLLRSIPVPKEA